MSLPVPTDTKFGGRWSGPGADNEHTARNSCQQENEQYFGKGTRIMGSRTDGLEEGYSTGRAPGPSPLDLYRKRNHRKGIGVREKGKIVMPCLQGVIRGRRILQPRKCIAWESCSTPPTPPPRSAPEKEPETS